MIVGGLLRKVPLGFLCGGPFKERSPTPLQTFLNNAYLGGYDILKLNGIRRGIRQVSLPVCDRRSRRKEKDIEKGNELPFSISFSFLIPNA